MPGTSLNVQWLRFYTFAVGCVCLIPGLGTKILTCCGQKKKKKKRQATAGSLSSGASTLAAYRTLQQNPGPPGRIHEQHSCHEPKNSWIMREHPPWDQRWENGVLRGRLLPRPFLFTELDTQVSGPLFQVPDRLSAQWKRMGR